MFASKNDVISVSSFSWQSKRIKSAQENSIGSKYAFVNICEFYKNDLLKEQGTKGMQDYLKGFMLTGLIINM